MTKAEFNKVDLREVFNSERVQKFWGVEEMARREKANGWKKGQLFKVNKKSIVYAEDFKFELKFFDDEDEKYSCAYMDNGDGFGYLAEIFESSENMAHNFKDLCDMMIDVMCYCFDRI